MYVACLETHELTHVNFLFPRSFRPWPKREPRSRDPPTILRFVEHSYNPKTLPTTQTFPLSFLLNGGTRSPLLDVHLEHEARVGHLNVHIYIRFDLSEMEPKFVETRLEKNTGGDKYIGDN